VDARDLRIALQKLRDDKDVSERLFRWLEDLVDFLDPHDAVTKPEMRSLSSSSWSNKEVLDALEEGKKKKP
jgi:hypothetical protein